MRFFDLPDGRPCSALGFGCGAVMGRVGKAASLRAMAESFEAGVNLFDTARSYGQGQSESVLGDFLRGKREQAVISTKFGIRADSGPGWKSFLLPAVRLAARQVPALRRAVRRRPEHQVTTAPLTIEHLQENLEQSLRHLKTDHVDFYFLHDVPAAVVQRDDLFAELEKVQQQGKVRWFGVSSSLDAAQSLLENRMAANAVQLPINLFNLRQARAVAAVADSPARANVPTIVLANHTFGGVEGAAFSRQKLRALTFNAKLSPTVRAKLPDTRGALLPTVVLPLVLQQAHAAIVSMMLPSNIRANVRAIDQDLWTEDELAQLFQILTQ